MHGRDLFVPNEYESVTPKKLKAGIQNVRKLLLFQLRKCRPADLCPTKQATVCGFAYGIVFAVHADRKSEVCHRIIDCIFADARSKIVVCRERGGKIERLHIQILDRTARPNTRLCLRFMVSQHRWIRAECC